jgi:acetyl-CoA C-acetyltransferase
MGGILTMTALDELERRDKQTAMISMCTGGAMGSAMLIERV